MEFLESAHAAQQLQRDVHGVDATFVVVFMEEGEAPDCVESLGFQAEGEILEVGRV